MKSRFVKNARNHFAVIVGGKLLVTSAKNRIEEKEKLIGKIFGDQKTALLLVNNRRLHKKHVLEQLTCLLFVKR